MKRNYVLLVIGFMMLAVGALLFANQPAFQWIKSRQISRGPFFRVDVKLKYKGEPLDMSFEVTCSAHITTYADNSNSNDVGLTPNVYGRRMSDGQALVVRPPDACNGESTANGQVPKNFMPIIIVYTNANTMDFGKAYISDDAYNGPLSEMTFESAAITASNQANFDAFRKDGPKNAVTREMWWSRQSEEITTKQGLKHFYPAFGETCESREKYIIPEIAKARLRASLSFRQNEYWSPLSQDEENQTYGLFTRAEMNLKEKILVTTETNPEPRFLSHYQASDPGYGVNRGDYKSQLSSTKFWTGRPAAPDYPTASNFASGKLPAELSKWPQALEKLKTLPGHFTDAQEGKYRGFAYCQNDPTPTGWNLDWMSKVAQISGFDVVDGRRIFTVPTEQKNVIYGSGYRPIFFGDQYLLRFSKTFLSSMRGDI